jgi:hypothetical protein
MATDYRDNTALTDAQKASLDGLATAIRTKMYGKDVREAMAAGLELAGTGAGTSLTPNGVVENVSELDTKYPQGTSGIFVNSSDGHWYYWNGTAWADGGAYQAAKFYFDGLLNWLPGLNLITGTSTDWVSTGQTWGHWSDYFTNVAGKTMTFSVKVKNVSGGNIFLGVILQDAAGNKIAFDGTPSTSGISYLSAAYTGADEKDYSYTFTVPSNAAQLKVGIGTDAVTTSFDYSSEFFAFGENGEYTKALSEYANNKKIVKVVENLNDRISEKNTDTSNSNLPVINITGNYGNMLANNVESVLPFSLDEAGRHLTGFIKTEWQGNSTLAAAKKGFKFKTYVDSAGKEKLKWRPMPSFYKNHSFNLKGYYTDKYSVRDAVCAEIYSRFIANNPTAPQKLLLANHFGTIQSMPCLLYFNKNFYGLMEMNTKSSSDLWNMDENDANEIAIEGNTNLAKGEWREGSPTLGDNGDFSLDSDNNTNAQAALTALASKIVVDSDDTFKTNVESIFDLNSICDVLIFNWLVNNSDIWSGKNNCYLTYDGGSKWFLMSYDFDSTLGSSWQEGTITPDDYDYFAHLTPTVGNQLLRRFLKLYPDKVFARFNELDSAGVLNIHDLQQIVAEKANAIGTEAYEKEYARWPDNPAYTEDLDLDHIKYMLGYRKQLLKSKLESMQGSAS